MNPKFKIEDKVITRIAELKGIYTIYNVVLVPNCGYFYQLQGDKTYFLREKDLILYKEKQSNHPLTTIFK